MWGYKLDEARHQAVRERLAALAAPHNPLAAAGGIEAGVLAAGE